MSPEAARVLRKMAIQRDNAGHYMRELAFSIFLRDTVFGQAVERRLREIAQETITTQQELDRLLRRYRHG